MKKIMSSLILFFLAFSLCSSLQFISSVSANFIPASVPEHSIEITVDGIEGTNKIRRNGNIYTFTGNIDGSIVVFHNGIVIDGAGYTLQGKGDLTGIWLQAKSNVEIRNLQIKNFNTGIKFTYGWSQDGCTNITLSGNTITDNHYGIRFSIFSNSNHVLDNNIANNTYGIHITHSPNNTFRNNQLTKNVYNLWISCETSVPMNHFINDIDTSNMINGKPVIYWVNEHHKTVPSDVGYVGLVNCKNITVQDQNISGNSQGILMVATSNSLITRNNLANNDYGVVLFAPYEQCIGNVITDNNITGSGKDGMNSWNSEDSVVTGNIVTGSQENGINFFDSRGAVISENTLFDNKEENIKIWGSESGDNTVSDNQYTSQSVDVPEFPSWTPLFLMSVSVIAVTVIYRRNLNKQNQRRKNQ
jgi:parallel beta-helix repeat protein